MTSIVFSIDRVFLRRRRRKTRTSSEISAHAFFTARSISFFSLFVIPVKDIMPESPEKDGRFAAERNSCYDIHTLVNRSMRIVLKTVFVLLILTLVVVAAAVYSGGALHWVTTGTATINPSQNLSPANLPDSQHEYVPSPADVSRSPKGDGWATCTNQKGGYSLLYPAGWITYGDGAYASESPIPQIPTPCVGLNVTFMSDAFVSNPRATRFNVEVLNEDRLRDTVHEGEQMIDDYYGKLPGVVISTIAGEKAVWLNDFPHPRIKVAHSGEFFGIDGYNITKELFTTILGTFTFLR